MLTASCRAHRKLSWNIAQEIAAGGGAGMGKLGTEAGNRREVSPIPKSFNHCEQN